MSLHVIGTGVGRTGTLSLKLALVQLGFGPCHHMTEVMAHMPRQLPLWQAAAAGQPDFAAIYDGYRSAVDWPTAGFFRELVAAYPDARFVHTERTPDSWVASFSETIYRFVADRDGLPPEMHPWHDMVTRVLTKTGFPPGLSEAELEQRFRAHNEAVRAAIPAEQLLIFHPKDGWQPLATFLGVPAPAGDFPRTNDRELFWKLVRGEAVA